MMAHTQEHYAQQAPEVVNSDFPEAVPHNSYQQHPAAKPENGAQGTRFSEHTPYSTHDGSQVGHASLPPFYSTPAPGSGAEAGGGSRGRRGTICGCTTLVFVLSSIIALLAAAVIGLAAGTGVEAHRADTAQARADRLNASLAAATSFAALDDNCSGDAQGVTGTTFNAFSVIGDYSFTIQCNKDALGNPLFSLFTADLNDCMNACAAYSQYTPANFGNSTNSTNSANTTCGAVSFVPAWTNKTVALNAGAGAPGNCYLKPSQTAAPNVPSGGTEVHAGILNFK